jgi:5-formyltetrahydrofolate cyclo-ligase
VRCERRSTLVCLRPAALEASVRAQARLLESAPARSARCVALYRALKSECATDALATALAAAGKDLCFPAVAPGERALRFLRPHGPLRRSALGIEEHEDLASARVPLAQIDLFVVPARAVDPLGHRLGRGKGHYDATLAAVGPQAARVCLVFDAQVVSTVPFATHDERVQFVCTESRWLDCAGGGA